MNLVRYKINTQKSNAFQYPNSEQSQKEIKKTIPFTTASKRRKYLEISLTKAFTMKMMTFLKELKEDK